MSYRSVSDEGTKIYKIDTKMQPGADLATGRGSTACQVPVTVSRMSTLSVWGTPGLLPPVKYLKYKI